MTKAAFGGPVVQTALPIGQQGVAAGRHPLQAGAKQHVLH